MAQPNFRNPVFVRNDFDSEMSASVVEWNGEKPEFSIRFQSAEQSVLIDSSDWERVKSCVDAELQRVGALEE